MVPAEELIDWRVAKLSVIEEVQKKQKPVVLFFMEEGMDAVDASREIHDAGLAKMSKEGRAFFLLIEHNPDRTPSLSNGSPIPSSKLMNPNPAREYGITQYPSVLVCDWHGNVYNRYANPTADELKRRIGEVSANMEAAEQRLRRNLETAKANLENKKMRDFFKVMLGSFREGTVGLKAQQDAIELYREVIENTREEIEAILRDKPADGVARLKAMSKDYRDTELRKEIDDALVILKG